MSKRKVIDINGLIKRLKFGEILAETETHVLTKPKNTWDMNYHVYCLTSGIEYLIDIGDIHDTMEDVDEYGGILYQDLINLHDIEMIKSVSWKTIKNEEETD